MPKARIQLHPKAIRALLRGDEMKAIVQARAEAIAAAAGEGMEASVQVGRNRVRGSVITATREAKQAEATDRALSRAVDAGRA